MSVRISKDSWSHPNPTLQIKSLLIIGDNYIEILPREKRQDLITGVLLPTGKTYIINFLLTFSFLAFKYAADHPDQVKGVFGKAKDSLSGLAKSGKHVVEKLANVTNKFKNTFKKWLGFGKSHASNEE